ncbi:MAG: hypothetical protein E3J64_03240 [Anaerolineales bacterium]|nr:MAG: hypothetical protein E3J64_03240 [Anaerolineales bacterium]
MTARTQTGPRQVDPGAVFIYLSEWAAQFHDDSSPARVTDVLVAFAFVAGVSFAAAGPAATATLLCWVEEEMPSASKRARLLARALLDSMAENPREVHGPISPSTQTGMAALRSTSWTPTAPTRPG